ncbi:MAG TPA: hypothetical protein VLA72_15380 [Anaerolineales bacterium]|nr:hypothetical protein [Anaerolineales bacterium]
MHLETIIKIIEGTVFEFLSWVFYIPYTAIRVLKPGWAQRHSINEYSDPEKENRFEGDMSPILYFLAVLIASLILASPDFSLSSSLLENFTQNTILTATLSAFSVPFLYALGVWLAKSIVQKEIAPKTELRRLFDIQSFLWGTFLLVFVASARMLYQFTRTSATDPFFPQSNPIITWIVIIYFLYLQIVALQLEFPQQKFRSSLVLVLLGILWYALIFMYMVAFPVLQPLQFLLGIG